MGCSSFSKARDSNSYKAQLKNGQIPKQQTNILTYEGVFNEHYYNITPEKKKILSLETSFAISNQYIRKKNKQEIWAGCLIKSVKDGQKRTDLPINISIVLDISGSMQSGLNNEQNFKFTTKLDLAKQAITNLYTQSLKQDDSIGLALFNTKGFTSQQLEKVSEINQDQFLEKVGKIQTCGGTTLQAGLQEGINMFPNEQKEKKQKRIIMITDMMDMQGTIMDDMIKKASENNIYVSIIGVGISFNSVLADSVIKHKGCNYFSITKNEEMIDVVVTNFDYNFFPNAFNVDLLMETKDYEIKEVYGTPFQTNVKKSMIDNSEFQSVTEINTCFPSPLRNNEQMRGGLILMKLKKKNPYSSGKIKFILQYTETPEKQNLIKDSYDLEINQIEEQEQYQKIIYSNGNIRKGIMLQQYVEINKEIIENPGFFEGQQFLIDELQETLQNFTDECQTFNEEDDINNKKSDLKNLIYILIKNNKINQNVNYQQVDKTNYNELQNQI